MSCGVGHRRGSNLALLWLWLRLVATTLIQSLAWEVPCVTGVALKRQNNNYNKIKRRFESKERFSDKARHYIIIKEEF